MQSLCVDSILDYKSKRICHAWDAAAGMHSSQRWMKRQGWAWIQGWMKRHERGADTKHRLEGPVGGQWQGWRRITVPYYIIYSFIQHVAVILSFCKYAHCSCHCIPSAVARCLCSSDGQLAARWLGYWLLVWVLMAFLWSCCDLCGKFIIQAL